MAIVVELPMGWVVDQRQMLSFHVHYSQDEIKKQNAEQCVVASELKSAKESTDMMKVGVDNKVCKKFQMKEDLFNIIAPFKMDSQCKPSDQSPDLNPAENALVHTKRKKKRKRKEPLNKGEELAELFHKKAQDQILHGFDCLIRAANNWGYFKLSYSEADNNMAARAAAQLAGPGESCGEICWRFKGLDVVVDVHLLSENGHTISNLKDACNTIYRNDRETSILLTVELQHYIIPPQSSFIMSDVSVFGRCAKDLGKFDLIVMDPPWLNKSVKRKKTYFSLENDVLLDLPLDTLMSPGCIVAVWVTNRCKHRDFVRHQLFNKYNITYRATWFWIKVTRSGEMVYSINSDHKKPYETLIVGQFVNVSSSDQGPLSFEENKLVVSVPSSLHSKKPPLTEILKAYLSEGSQCLELFARNLLPYWTSWGNEVLLHQHEEFYEEVT